MIEKMTELENVQNIQYGHNNAIQILSQSPDQNMNTDGDYYYIYSLHFNQSYSYLLLFMPLFYVLF